MARIINISSSTNLVSTPSYSGTEDKSPSWADGSWGRPNLSDFPDVESDQTWSDLSEGSRSDIADHFIDGEASDDAYSDLRYPVVNPSTGALNRNGVIAARQRASAEDDNRVLSVAEDLMGEFSDEEDDMSIGLTIIRSGSEEKAEQLRTNQPRRAYFSASLNEIEPDEAALAKINRDHSDIELEASDVVLFEDYAAHDTTPDVGARRSIGFETSALEKFAQDFQKGRTFNLHHNERRQVGSTYDASVERADVDGIDANWLKVQWYAVTGAGDLGVSESREQDILDLSTGVLPYTSLEVRGGEWSKEELSSGHYTLIADNPGASETDRLTAEGIARVHLGAIKGAQST